MGIRFIVVAIALMALASSFAHSSNSSPLQDFCVAVNDSMANVFVDGKICKNPTEVDVDDFLYRGLNIPGNTSNQLGSKITLVNVDNLPGLNTLGVSMSRIDYAPGGLNPPHAHPRSSEIFVVMEGTLRVGFVVSNNPPSGITTNKLFTKTLYPGDVFVYPQGLVHFQLNIGKSNALAFAGFGSQNPGIVIIANAVFGSDSHINPEVLTKAFQVDDNVVNYLQSQSWYDNS